MARLGDFYTSLKLEKQWVNYVVYIVYLISSPSLECTIADDSIRRTNSKRNKIKLKGLYHGNDLFTKSLAYSSVNTSKYLSIACRFYSCVAKPANDIVSDTSQMLLKCSRWIQSRLGHPYEIVVFSVLNDNLLLDIVLFVLWWMDRCSMIVDLEDE